MDIRFSGKNLSVTEGMKEHLREKLVKLDKYAPRLIESHVILKKEKYFFVVEITLLAKDLRAYGEGTGKDNIFTAMDQAYSRIEKQLKRFREKIKDHHKHGTPEQPVVGSRVSEIPAASPRIVRSRGFAPKPMSIEEASLQIGLSAGSFLVFQNASTQKVNVIFKREDGNHGLIEPKF